MEPLAAPPVRRSNRDRREARKAAAAAAKAAVHRQALEARAWRRLYEDLAAALGAAGADGELSRRLAAAAPALGALVRGEEPTAVARLRRNVALHAVAEGIDAGVCGGAFKKVPFHLELEEETVLESAAPKAVESGAECVTKDPYGRIHVESEAATTGWLAPGTWQLKDPATEAEIFV
ncbi:unnamed protein product [Prorocentrum cordatum]|uniref:Uncharacterized protein n=1 Tax=Prorocentrum cordatum TaxID=2364126 RepID=A0ABN9PD78_9DINO|nr:unnamed protein product [Polarella glacialis]